MLSDNCHSNLPPPTEQGFCAWLAIAQQRLDRLAHTPATSLGDLEIAVLEELHRLGASLLTQAANRQAQATAFLCSRCQQPLAREAKNHVRKIDSVVGPLQLSRDYGWCPKCQDWCYPADARWGLQPNAPASPRVQEMAAEAVLKMPCAKPNSHCLVWAVARSVQLLSIARPRAKESVLWLCSRRISIGPPPSRASFIWLPRPPLPKSLLCSLLNWMLGTSASALIGAAPKPCAKREKNPNAGTGFTPLRSSG